MLTPNHASTVRANSTRESTRYITNFLSQSSYWTMQPITSNFGQLDQSTEQTICNIHGTPESTQPTIVWPGQTFPPKLARCLCTTVTTQARLLIRTRLGKSTIYSLQMLDCKALYSLQIFHARLQAPAQSKYLRVRLRHTASGSACRPLLSPHPSALPVT